MIKRQFENAKPGERWLGVKDLPPKGVPFHLNHLRRLWNDGRFPPPVHLSARRLAWPESVIDAWLASKMEAA